MNIYTKNGDRGTTSLMNGISVSKADDRIENSFPRIKDFVLYGGCELSARLDVARAVTRRAERRFRKVEQNYGADAKAVQYINRLSDYLYMCARYADYKVENEKADGINDKVVKNILGNM